MDVRASMPDAPPHCPPAPDPLANLPIAAVPASPAHTVMTRFGAQTRIAPTPLWHHQAYSMRALDDAIVRLLPDKPQALADRLVVDFGCGDQRYKPLWQAMGARYVGIGFTPELTPAAETQLDDGQPDLMLAPGQPTPLPSGCADWVTAIQVLEHLWQIDPYLQECARLLRPGGNLLLASHGASLYRPAPDDFRRWTRIGLVRELTERGWQLEGIRAIIGPLAWSTQVRMISMHRVLSQLPACRPLGLALSAALGTVMHARMAFEDRITPLAVREDNAAIYVLRLRRPVSL